MGTYSNAIFKNVIGTLFGSDSGAATWGSIGGTLANQTDLVAAIAAATGGWTTVRLTSDFSTTSNVLTDVTAMEFTPASNAHYEVHFFGLMRTSNAATAAARPGITWPLGVGDGTAFGQAASSASATTPTYGNTSAATFSLNTNLMADATGSWPAEIRANFLTGTITAPFKIGLRSQVNGTSVTMKAGSFFRYRRIA